MPDTIALFVLAAAIALVGYTYFGYPLVLRLLGSVSRKSIPTPTDDHDWPHISFSVPAYNEEAQIEELIRSLLALDYPRDRMDILVVSDASDDRTDEIVNGYADQGVRLLRMSERGGKNKAENAAAHELSTDIIVNTDASIRIAPDALKPLIAVFSDPSIGCASGRDVSVGSDEDIANAGESGYVGYEMKIRDLETKVSGIVGASGCFYRDPKPFASAPATGAVLSGFFRRTPRQGARIPPRLGDRCRLLRTSYDVLEEGVPQKGPDNHARYADALVQAPPDEPVQPRLVRLDAVQPQGLSLGSALGGSGGGARTRRTCRGRSPLGPGRHRSWGAGSAPGDDRMGPGRGRFRSEGVLRPGLPRRRKPLSDARVPPCGQRWRGRTLGADPT